MLKNRIYKIANNPSFDFFWHNGEKIVQDALSFRLFKNVTCTLSSRGVSRKYYITTVTGNLRDETVVNLLRITASLRDLLEFVNKPQGFFFNKMAIIQRFRK